jgi:UDP-2,4-diacetamido-2,4,6-trideoxy-beta-L-altropyranose hydrolase
MKVAFRTDASLEIGAGHVARCLTLAHELTRNGVECFFICKACPGDMHALITSQGFQVHSLALNCVEELLNDIYQREDARQTQACLIGVQLDWLIVDHYELGVEWEMSVKPLTTRLMVIDDLASRSHVCDVLLDHNLGRTSADYAHLVPNTCQILAGSAYALLRSEFAALREASLQRRRSAQLTHVLIAMGGVDLENSTTLMLDALAQCAGSKITSVTVVMGAHAPWRSSVEALAVKMPWPTKVLINVQDMAQLMLNSDLAIGATGGTAWERCCLGLPSVVLAIAENQTNGAKALHKAGAVIALDSHINLVDQFREALNVLKDPMRMSAMTQACSRIVDGQGVKRVVSEMKK